MTTTDSLRAKLRSILAEVENTEGCHEWPQRTQGDDNYCAGCEIGHLVQGAMMDLDDYCDEGRDMTDE